MNKKSGTSKDAADKLVKGIRRKTRKQYSAEEKIRIVLAGPPAEERATDQGPRAKDREPRTVVRIPRTSARDPRTVAKRRGPWSLELGPRLPNPKMLFFNSHFGADMQFKRGNEIGVATRFGPDWPGERCGARTKAGTLCQRPAVKKTGRCTRHGGKSTGPRTEEGRARIAAAQLKHGRLTKEARAEAKRRAQVGREIRAELREIERELMAGGLLAKDWRAAFEPMPGE